MTIQQREIPRKALFFKGVENVSVIAGTVEQPLERLEMLVYSGAPITGHWYWGTCVIDLQGGQYPKDRYPVLKDHDPDQIIGYTGLPIVDFTGIRLDPNTTVFCDTPESQTFRARSKEGFPYEASIHFEPIRMEEIEDGAITEVNGYTLTGPATVIRQWTYKEGSICVFGWDSHTQSAAMKEGDKLLLNIEVCGNKMNTQSNGENSMAEVHVKTDGDANAQSENPPPQNDAPKEDGGKYATIEEARAAIEAALKAFPELKDEIVGSGGENQDKPPADNKEMAEPQADDKKKDDEEKKMSDKRIAALEKELAQQKMSAAKESADSIISVALSQVDQNDVEKLYLRLSKLVPFQSHIKNGVLDKTAFKAAITNEVEYLTGLKPSSGKEILGFGAMSQGNSADAEDKATIERMLKMSRSNKAAPDDQFKNFMSAFVAAAKQSGIGG